MKKRYIFALSVVALSLTACFHKDKPNYQYMADTDMYFPVGYRSEEHTSELQSR